MAPTGVNPPSSRGSKITILRMAPDSTFNASVDGSSSDSLRNRIAQWLRARRADIAARMTAHRLPLAISEEVQIAEHVPSGGMTGDVERRTASAYRQFAWQFRGIPGITQPFIDGAGESLARKVVETFGSVVTYFAQSGPGVLREQLEHPEIVEAMVASPSSSPDLFASMLAFDPLFYSLMVLRQCLAEYLTTLPTLGADDIETSERLASEAVTFFGSPEVVHVARIPIAGLDVSDGDIQADGVTIRRLTREELGYLFWRRGPFVEVSRTARSMPRVWRPEQMLMERVMLEVRERRPKTMLHQPAVAAQRTLLALHLTGLKFAGSGFGAMLEEPPWVQGGFGQSGYPLLMPTTYVESVTTISQGQLAAVAELAPRIPESGITAAASPRDLAISRLAFAMSRADPREALVDYTVALEALLLSGEDVAEARRRFALNGAVFIGSTKEERRDLYRQLLDIYKARSVLVHGVDPSDRRARRVYADIARLRDDANRIACQAVVRALRAQWPTDADFVAALLDDRPEM